MTMDTSHERFGDGTNYTAWGAAHESLHSAGLSDQKFLSSFAYRITGHFREQRAFQKLSIEKRVKNPDHILSLVWP